VTYRRSPHGLLELVGTKLTGDPNVPAGERSWAVALQDEWGESIELGATLDARVQVAEAGFVNAHDVPASIVVRSASALLLTLHEGSSAGSPLLFRRCSASQLWFIDAFARGQLVTADACRHVLSSAGLPPRRHASTLTAAAPARVWARMCRNLMHYARREGDSERARFWEGVECGLDEVVDEVEGGGEEQQRRVED